MMRRVLLSLVALFLLVAGAQAEPKTTQLAYGGFGAGSNLTGFWQTKAAPTGPTLTWIGSNTSGSNASAYTFTAENVGVAAADRKTIVVACGDASTASWTYTSITVGGSSATEAVETANASSLEECAVYIIDNTAGTAEDIVVTVSKTITNMQIGVWAAYGLNSSTATATNKDFDTAAALLNSNVNVNAGGIAVGGCSTNGGAETATWVGLSDHGSASQGSEISYSFADTTVGAAQSPLSISCDFTGSDDAIVVTASFR